MAKAKKDAKPERPLKNDPACERCDLHARSGTVCCESSGPRNAHLFLVGEALGAHEEEVGRAFVGDAGFKLNYLLHRARIPRKTCRIGNCVRCRPPGNKTPSKKQLTACWPYLLHDILTGRPKVIVALGATAINTLLPPPRRGVDACRGFPEEVTFRWESPKGKVYEHKCWVMPTYHPAACLHDWRHDDLVVRDLEAAAVMAAGSAYYDWPDTKVVVVKTLEEAITLLRQLRRVGRFVTDLETTGLDPHTAHILCAGFCYKEGHASILPLRKQGGKLAWKQHEFDQIVAELTETLEQSVLYGQNIKFDLKHYRKLTGLTHFRVGFDTMNAHHCVDENKPHNLTFMCQWYLRWLKYDTLVSSFHGRVNGYADVPDGVLHRYCGYDVDGTWRVRKHLVKELKRENAMEPFRAEVGLINALADVEYRGVRVNVDKIDELASIYRTKMQKSLVYIQSLAQRKLGQDWIDKQKDKRFNPNSTVQLAALLQKCGAGLRKKTRGGQLAVDKNVLAALELRSNTAGTIARRMREIRKLTKYVSTYLDGKDGSGGFKQWVRSKNRIHASYNIATARTGRLSADDPPLQTVPRVGGLREMFIPDSPDHIFLSIDYSKIELRVMAYLANDEVMCRELIRGDDLHSRMALTKRLNRDPTDEEFKQLVDTVTKQERAVAKGVNFGVPYGIGEDAIVEQNPDVFPINMPKQERKKIVRKIMEAYFDKYWGVADFREKCIRLAHKRGYMLTLLRRKRRLTAIDWFTSKWGMETERRDLDLGHLEREAMNFPIQSYASDSLSRATKRVYDTIRRVRIPALRIVMTLHDQLVFNVHRDYTEEVQPLLVGAMEFVLPKDSRHKFEMPITVDVNVQKAWGLSLTGETEY